jgi:hypothetical protein
VIPADGDLENFNGTFLLTASCYPQAIVLEENARLRISVNPKLFKGKI